jgi:hypothetical protein
MGNRLNSELKLNKEARNQSWILGDVEAKEVDFNHALPVEENLNDTEIFRNLAFYSW